MNLIGQARHHTDVLAPLRIERDVEVVELGAVVIADQACHLLETVRLEIP